MAEKHSLSETVSNDDKCIRGNDAYILQLQNSREKRSDFLRFSQDQLNHALCEAAGLLWVGSLVSSIDPVPGRQDKAPTRIFE